MEQSKIEKADKKACKLIDRELSIKMDTLFLTLEADSDSYADDLKCFKLNNPERNPSPVRRMEITF